jgi:branched-chain amino acid aminotransferase
MPKSFAFLNNKFLPLEEAKISVMTHAFLYGTAVFEGLRAYYNEQSEELYVFRPAEHFYRFLNSCRIIKIALDQTVDQLISLTTELLRKCEFREDIYIRPVAFKSAERIGLRLDDQDGLTIFAVPMGSYLARDHALHLMISSWRRVEDNAIPARAKINGSYVNLALAAAEARENGFDEAILLNENGSVSEAAGMNLFIVRNKELITPSVSENVLEGITRDTIFQIAKDHGISCHERTVDRSELYAAEEVFICGTGAEISPVGTIDHRKIASGEMGPITSKIQQIYFDTVRGNHELYRQWVVPIWKPVVHVQES